MEDDSSRPRPGSSKRPNTRETDASLPSTSANARDIDLVPHDLGKQLSLEHSDVPERLNTEHEHITSTKLTHFKQQTLSAWKPVFKVGTLYWKFLIAGLVYIPLGILLNLSSKGLTEIVVPYTDCKSLADQTITCADFIANYPGSTCECEVEFNITKDIDSQVYMYYALTNYFQNHRMYVKSKDNNQLYGDIGSKDNLKNPNSDCKPYDYVDTKDSDGKTIRKRIIPCGAIANSLFNDSISICRLDHDTGYTNPPHCEPVALKRTGIAWDSDKKYKFKNPPYFNNREDPIWTNFTHPPDWGRTIWDLDEENPENNGLQNEDLIVWMRTAALPNFRKPYRIIEDKGLLAGTYRLSINYTYKTKSFGGTKSIVLCTHSFVGSKNPALGIVFSVVGGLSVLIALIFLYIFITTDRRRRLDLDEFTVNE